MLYIDASRYSSTGKRTGVENYSYFLINELVKEHGKEVTLITPKKINLNVSQIIIPFPRLWTLFRLSWEILRNKKINNLFVPSHVLPLITPKKSIITIHDVVFKYSPKSYSVASRIYLDWAAKFAVKHASKIIVPSEATKQDLVQFYKAKSDRINVIPLGFSPTEKTTKEELKKTLEKFSLQNQKYFLYLGRLEFKKNTDTLLKAFEEFSKEDSKIKLVLTGFPGHGGKKILEKIPFKLKNRIIQTGYVSETEKAVLLQNTLCFVFPSRFEGFGLPLLEAMNAKVPIISSSIPSSKEVAGDNALFFEKEDSKTLGHLMKRVVNEPDLREKMIENHSKTLQKYSWEKCTNEVYNLIRKEI